MWSKIKNQYQRHGWWIVWVLFFVMQLPFIQADPIVDLSISRDAFTDEGLNTSQVRNWANYGKWDIMECDNLIKTPLFNGLLALPFKLFGTYWPTARLTVLITVVFLLLFTASFKPMKDYMPAFFLLVFIQFHPFHYSHFSMAEMLAVSCVVASVAFWIKYAIQPSFYSKSHWLYISLIFATLAWWFKVQFAYLIFLIPISTLWLWLFSHHHTLRGKKLFFSTLYLLAVVVFTVLLYIVIWYLPNKDAWLYIMNDQTTGRFPPWNLLVKVVGISNFIQYFIKPTFLPFFIAFILCIPISIRFYLKQKSPYIVSLLIILTTWLMLEVHKMFMYYVPGRYLVSLFVALELFTVSVGLEFAKWLLIQYKSNTDKKYQRRFVVVIVILILLFFNNAFYYVKSLTHRTYVIHNVSSYVRQSLPEKVVALGTWSPALTWGTSLRAVPVWKDFLNDKNILERFRPRIIFSEPQEGESSGAFTADGINLLELSDSVNSYIIGKWPVNLYWINQQKLQQAIEKRNR